MPRISQLFVYPLKSAQGIPLEVMDIDLAGPRYDREWMLVNKNDLFVSQRTHPGIGLFKTSISKNYFSVHAPTGDVLKIDLDDWGEISQSNAMIFGKEVAIKIYPEAFNSFFSDLLKDSLRLVRTPAEKPRRTSGNHGPLSPLNFSDGYPFLLTSEASLAELNEKLLAPVSMLRFRPNIVLTKVDSGQEDLWKQFKISDVEFLSVKACTRCSVINIVPGTMESDKEVTQALKTYRKKNNTIVFGQNLTHCNRGKIHVGDFLENIVKKEN